MLSRVAENLYWISRYVERAENVARLLDVGFHLELDAPDVSKREGDLGPIESVLSILNCHETFEKAHGKPLSSSEKDREAVLEFLTFDRRHAHSIVSMLGRARENARASQETLSAELWSQINKIYLYLLSRRASKRFRESPSHFFDGIKRACILFDGLVDGTLPRNEVYHFLQLGRYLERVNQVSRILNTKMHGHRDDGTSADPSLREISGGDDEVGFSSEAERVLGRLDSELRYLDTQEIFAQGLPKFLIGVQQACTRIGFEIHQAYFHTQP